MRARTKAVAAASTSLFDLALTNIDLTDGSWTLLDPLSIVDTITHDGTYNTVTFNAQDATTNINWGGSSSSKEGARWYKLLTIDANQITTDDLLDALVVHEMHADTDWNGAWVIGTAEDPSSTTAAVLLGQGAYGYKNGANITYGAWTNTANTASGSATTVRSHASWRSGPRYGGDVSYMNIDSSDLRIASSVRSLATALSSTVNLYLMVGVGARNGSTAIGAGDVTRFRADYTMLKAALP